MTDRKIESLDLNLLLALHWLLAERSVTLAAARLNLSQPATSRALGRLRAVFDDPLLVKSGRVMLPTPTAERLQPAIADAIDALRNVLRVTEAFDPATQAGRVRIASFDYIGVMLSEVWIESISRDAPGLELDIVDLTFASARDLISGQIDLVIMPDMRLAQRRPTVDLDQFVHKPLFTDRFTSCVRAGHPLTDQPVTMEDFIAQDHVLINPEGKATGIVDQILAEQGLSRRIAFRTEGFLTALAMVAASEAILTAPSALFAVLPEKFHVFDPPLSLPDISMQAAWHPNWTQDPRHRWLRERLFAGFRRRAC